MVGIILFLENYSLSRGGKGKGKTLTHCALNLLRFPAALFEDNTADNG
jgi:hypothetical protein